MSGFEAVRETDQYRDLEAQLANREWRLDHLYRIKNKDGLDIPFTRNFAQRHYAEREWFRDVIAKSRKLGFSTYIEIEILDDCLFTENVTADIVDYTVDDAEAKLDIVKFAYERLPKSLRDGVPMVKSNNSEVVFGNGSSVSAGTGSRGGTPQILHISEIGKIAQMKPQVAKEIRTGSITAVPQTGKIYAESTAHGTSGEFYDMVKRAEKLKLQGARLSPIDFKLHFYGWFLDPDNRIQSSLATLTPELREYFAALLKEQGIKADADQMAWYAKEYERLGPDDIKSEHPSHVGELFFASLEGAYYKEALSRARRQGRIGHEVPWDSSRPVNTFWDIGIDDENVVGFHQSDGVRHRVIDCVRWTGEGISGGVRMLREKHEQRGFMYGKHYGPHDLNNKDWSQFTAMSRKEVAAEHGINFIVVPRVLDKADSIDAGRRLIDNTWFCSKWAASLVDNLDNYTKRWDKVNSRWSGEPAKNGHDHGADAWQQLAMAVQPDSVAAAKRGRRERQRGSQWAG